MTAAYLSVGETPTREQIDNTPGLVLLEFGTAWCGHCQALAPHVFRMLNEHADVQQIRVEDGSGRALGRSFGVRLWPNLVFLKDGVVLRQLARPRPAELSSAFAALAQQG
jgi:thioredoxin 1